MNNDNKDYMFKCSGCHKSDKTYWYNDEGKPEADSELYGYPTIEHHYFRRQDYYGIYTGLYCDKCYNDPFVYTYRKEDYYDPAYAGERLEPDE